MNKKPLKNYLPSKKFIYSIVILIVLGILFFIISSLISKKTLFFGSKEDKLKTANLTINELIKKDSDGDKVMDWEEALWGTDPEKTATFDNVPDAEYIKQKRKEAKIASGENISDQTGGPLNETDKFAQEFFASFTAMQQNGQIDPQTINNVSTSLGQKISDPNLIDKYTEKDVKIADGDGVAKQKIYYKAVQKLFATYSAKGIGDEMTVINNTQTEETEVEAYAKLSTIADAYQEYAQKMNEIPVPQSLLQYHLKVSNNANNTGIAIRNLTNMATDPIVGLSGLSQYEKYSDDLISSVGEMQTILIGNGINL